MPVNKKGKGGKRVRRGKKIGGEEVDAPIPFKNDQQEYAQVTKLLGNMNILARIFGDNNKEKLCVIPGKFKKKLWINKDDIILISNRSFQEDKCDVIYKYSPNEARKLIKFGEIIADESIIVNDTDQQDTPNDDDIEVVDDDQPSEEIDLATL